MSGEQFPAWLSTWLINNDFNWEQATTTTFPELLRRVSFHDGYWHGCFPVLYNNSLLLVLQPDAIWNPEFCHQQEHWPYLIIEVSRVLNLVREIVPEDFMPTISNAESAPVDAARFSEWLEFAKVYDLLPADFFDHQQPKPPLHRTEIYLLINGALSILHEAPIRLLLYTVTGEQLSINLEA